MYLTNTRIVLPWNLANNSNSTATMAHYHWSPSPLVATMVVVVMVVFTLAPAVCSVCFHLYRRCAKVRPWSIPATGPSTFLD